MELEALLQQMGLLTIVTFLIIEGAKYVFPKWGKTGIRLFAILVAFLFALVKFGWVYLPAEYGKFIVELVALTTGFYHIIWKWIVGGLKDKLAKLF